MNALALAAALAATSLSAQDPEYVGPDDGYVVIKPEVSLVGSFRFSGISGSADEVYYGSDLHYSDIFDGGVGFEVEGRILWDVNQDGWLVGGYMSLGGDSFGGDTYIDPVGDSLKTDGLDTSTIMVGFMGVHRFPGGGLHFGFNAGVGLVNYDTVDGTLTINSGGPPATVSSVDVFKETTAGAFEVGGQFGVGGEHLFFEAGLGLRFQGAPDDGDLLLDPGPAAVATFDLAVGVRF